jgi:hypothetical protein
MKTLDLVLVVVVLVIARFTVVWSETPAACFSLFLLFQPCNWPQSVIDHEDNYKDEVVPSD